MLPVAIRLIFPGPMYQPQVLRIEDIMKNTVVT